MHYIHYIIIIVIIVVIVSFQSFTFFDTYRKIKIFLRIFPDESDKYKFSRESLAEKIKDIRDDDIEKMLVGAGLNPKDYYNTQTSAAKNATPFFFRIKAEKDLIEKLGNGTGISVNHSNSILKTIVDSINIYLKNNKSVNDFHLMKDIVDRNCDAKEEEINTQIPIPLYMGLVGTMAGILIGILYLWLSGGIGNLLNAGGDTNSGTGVEALLGGVALAMISSIWGIILTTWGSNKFKTAKSIVESDKHIFLSWIQAKLLPALSNNIVDTLERMTNNLSTFNDTFSSNTKELGTTLAEVNQSYVLQKQLFDAVKQIADKDISIQNFNLYNTLKNSAKEIQTLAGYLNNTNEYLDNVRALNEKLDTQESRTRAIEEMCVFFKSEVGEIEQRKQAISLAVGKVDDYLKQALEKLKDNADNLFLELQKSTIKQQNLLKQKTEEINTIVGELQNLTAIKDSISRFEQAMRAQNGKLDNLAHFIQELIESKNINDIDFGKPKIPVWQKTFIWGGSIIGGLLLLAFLIANWENIYNGLIGFFRI